ncbi:MAG: nicotinate (nicotinamide) nucleotide adenylyltransferase [Chlamydiia bacterium]|nr:nicotinate (nicotinamide) nucleotide adenylyltransferase [Chlamydiia bacterium]
MKLGFFGGSFDPIHLGHLNLAIRIMELKGLDRVLFSPARVSPFKQENPPHAPANHRLNLLQLALEDVPNCDPYDGELQEEGPSYTIDAIRKLEGEGELYLILAEDAASHLNQWKEAQQLIQRARPLVGVRSVEDKDSLKNLPAPLKEIVESGRVEIPLMDVCSTEVRERLKKRLYCGHLLQGKVLDYIHQNSLYYS